MSSAFSLVKSALPLNAAKDLGVSGNKTQQTVNLKPPYQFKVSENRLAQSVIAGVAKKHAPKRTSKLGCDCRCVSVVQHIYWFRVYRILYCLHHHWQLEREL